MLLSEAMNFPLSVSPSKTTSVGMNPQHLDLITVALLTELEARQEQIASDYGGNCGNVNVKSTRFQACSDSSNMKQLIYIQINPKLSDSEASQQLL